jgi:hypothetical protein
MVTSGLHKLQIADWWGGLALWYPLHPPFQTTAEGLKREAANASATLFGLSVLAYAVLAWQLCLPFFAWRSGRAWRVLLLGGAAIGWAGSVLLFKLPLFGPFVFIACLSYLRPEEWAPLTNGLQWLTGGSTVKKIETTKVAVASTAIKK